jgi:dihydropteroate synthase
MYSKDATPRTTIASVQYDDVVATISSFLRERKEAACRAGIPEERIILDPGLGHFVSSEPAYSFEVLRRLLEFESLGSPLLLSPSRKSFLAGRANLATKDRLPGTIAASVIAVLNGASYIRTHDVAEIRRACDAATAALG